MSSLSFRYRIPIDISLVVLATGLSIAAIVLWHDYRALRADLSGNAEQLAGTLAQALVPPLSLDDRWQAYRTVTALYNGSGSSPSWLLPTFVLVLAPDGRTLVSSNPRRFPIASEPVGLDKDQAMLTTGSGGSRTGSLAREFEGKRLTDQWMYQVKPLRDGEALVGTLILAFSRQALWPRFYGSALWVMLATAAILLLLLPVGWWIGWRIARPLIMLEQCVAQMGDHTVGKTGDPQRGAADKPPRCPVPVHGELGRLRERIEQVATEMRSRKALEAQVMRSERQAALGRMAAGIAHEVNNPLAGMLTAIAMYHRHGCDEQVTRHTLSLLERGLEQIRGTVSALLVEVRPDPGRFGPGDMADIAELIAPQVRERQLCLDWDNQLAEELPLPAGAVRRVLLNLALNAAQAAPQGSTVTARAWVDAGQLQLSVGNSGEAIPQARQALLFEPFASGRGDGSGLGLWLVDQQVRQLHGRIDVLSEPGQTVFTIYLPLGEPNG